MTNSANVTAAAAAAAEAVALGAALANPAIAQAAAAALAANNTAALYAELYAELGEVNDVISEADYADIQAAAARPPLTWATLAAEDWYPIDIMPGRDTYECGALDLDGILTVVYAGWHAKELHSMRPGDVVWAQYDSEDGVWEWEWPGCPGSRD